MSNFLNTSLFTFYGTLCSYIDYTSIHLTNVQHYYSCANAFKSSFLAKAYCKMVFKSAKNLEATKFHGNPYY